MTLALSMSHREKQREKITENKVCEKKLLWLPRLQMHYGSLVSLLLSTDSGPCAQTAIMELYCTVIMLVYELILQCLMIQDF